MGSGETQWGVQQREVCKSLYNPPSAFWTNLAAHLPSASTLLYLFPQHPLMHGPETLRNKTTLWKSCWKPAILLSPGLSHCRLACNQKTCCFQQDFGSATLNKIILDCLFICPFYKPVGKKPRQQFAFFFSEVLPAIGATRSLSSLTYSCL